MKRYAFAVICLVLAGIGSEGVSACGDKFLMPGRGMRFQRIYAAVYPAKILLVTPPKSVKVAAIRDPRLKSALTSAGHSVHVVSAAKLAEALASSQYDIVLAGRAEAMAMPVHPGAAVRKPSLIAVVEETGAADPVAGRAGLDAVIKAPQPLPDILRVLDDVMSARRDRARASTF
jgi:hypothetical protein